MGPLLYRPPPRWQGWAALGGAVAIHFAAVAIASIHPTEKVVDLSDIPEAVVDVSLEQQATPEPTPDEEPPPPPPPEAIPEQKSEFVEEQSTPPPKRPPSNKPVVPIARPSSTGKAAMVYKPHIEYPYEARRSKITGSGVIVVAVGSGGEVTEASMGVSTGNAILDNAATSAFRRARFNPGTAPKVKIPITFTLTGASY
jgi:periplasmic protein TonB